MEVYRKLSIWAIVSLVEGAGLPYFGGHLELQWGFGGPLTDMGHKGLVKA